MPWRQDSIRLEAAQRIFNDVQLKEVLSPIDDKVIGYSAIVHGRSVRNANLTELCCEIRQLERRKTA